MSRDRYQNCLSDTTQYSTLEFCVLPVSRHNQGYWHSSYRTNSYQKARAKAEELIEDGHDRVSIYELKSFVMARAMVWSDDEKQGRVAVFKKHNRQWDREEDRLMMQLHKEGYRWNAIARKLGRTRSACQSRYKRIIPRWNDSDEPTGETEWE